MFQRGPHGNLTILTKIAILLKYKMDKNGIL